MQDAADAAIAYLQTACYSDANFTYCNDDGSKLFELDVSHTMV